MKKQMKTKHVKMKATALVMATLMAFAGCGAQESSAEATSQVTETIATQAVVSTEAATETAQTTEASVETVEAVAITEAVEKVAVKVGSMKGPTSMGLMFLMEDAENGEATHNYEFQMATAADELLPLMIKGELDIALVPANVASVLYNKTEGGISVIDINTLGVLYMVSGDDSIASVADLKGKTIYLTGKGTTPDYVLQYLLKENGFVDGDCTIEYKSEATEVAAVLAENPDAVGLLPQPFVTAACAQNDALKVVLDTNVEWDKLQGEGGSRLVTGVTVVRNAFLEENKEVVDAFLAEHASSAEAINADATTGAALVVEAGIIAKEPLAQKAIPNCNITCITGEEMKQALAGYLNVLFEQAPESVGGALPGDEFYYVP